MNTTNGAATGKAYSKTHSTWSCEGDRPVLRVRHPMSGRVEIVDLTGKVVDGQSVPGFYKVVDHT